MRWSDRKPEDDKEMEEMKRELPNVAFLALRPAYRLALLASEGKNMPLITWYCTGRNHYQSTLTDPEDAKKALANGKKIDVFVVDSLGWSLDAREALKLFILAVLRFMNEGLEWMKDTLTKPRQDILNAVNNAVSGILEEAKGVTLNPKGISMTQGNGFDCGIFCVIQMNRLSKHLYSGNFKTGDNLTAENIKECLHMTIDKSKAPNQKFVSVWRKSEFLYLLSLWIRTFTSMIVTHGGLKGLNQHLKTNFKSISDVPYTSVLFRGEKHYIQSVDYKKFKLTINKSNTDSLTVSWDDVNITTSPTASELEKIFIIDLKEQSDKVTYVPSTNDLCCFFPGHTQDEDKYIRSDYIFWKLRFMDSKITGKPDDPNVNVGLGINTFHMQKAVDFLKPPKKRKLGEISLIDEDD
jgi:hypothetical protein